MTTAPIAILAALEREADVLEPLKGHGVRVIVTGMGAAAARESAVDATAQGAAGLISWGFAGALDPTIGAGQTVIPDRIQTALGEEHDVDVAWAATFRERLAERNLIAGTLIEVERPLLRPADKKKARAFGALACDMESAAIQAVARENGVPFVGLRTIVDEQRDTLAPQVTALTDDRGRLLLHRLPALIACPSAWPSIAKMTIRYGRARRAMEELVATLAVNGVPVVNPT